MYHHLLQLKKGSSVEQASLELEGLLLHLYEIEDPDTRGIHLGGYSEQAILPLLVHTDLLFSEPVSEIDWTEQWKAFAPGFDGEILEINLDQVILKLKPGGGFGDLSHPTTHLALEFIREEARGKLVFDIGCGSGILSIAAALLGATEVIGIDIDPVAIQHSRENAALNCVEDRVLFTTAIRQEPANAPILIAMNMIRSEQKTAWESQKPLHGKKAIIITSGILASEEGDYLNWTETLGWRLLEVKEKGEWLGFKFGMGSKPHPNIGV